MLRITIAGRVATGKTTMALALEQCLLENGFTNIVINDEDVRSGSFDPHTQGDRLHAIRNARIVVDTILLNRTHNSV